MFVLGEECNAVALTSQPNSTPGSGWRYRECGWNDQSACRDSYSSAKTNRKFGRVGSAVGAVATEGLGLGRGVGLGVFGERVPGGSDRVGVDVGMEKSGNVVGRGVGEGVGVGVGDGVGDGAGLGVGEKFALEVGAGVGVGVGKGVGDEVGARAGPTVGRGFGLGAEFGTAVGDKVETETVAIVGAVVVGARAGALPASPRS